MLDFWSRVNNWYFYILSGIFILAVILFFFLEKNKRKKPEYYLSFSLILLSVFYEYLAAATVQFIEINKWLYGIFNYPQENNYNLWVYNFFGYHITSLLFLALIYHYLFSPLKKNIIKGLSLFFIFSYVIFQALGIESLFEQQTYSIFVGYSAVIIACGLYFMELISHPGYLEINPLKAFSFWQVTVILFNKSLKFLLEISFNYIISVSMNLMSSLYLISKITWILVLCSFLFTILLNTRFFKAKELSYE
ncbi:hypothetical protein [Algoriphagus boritolerans]|uniref:Uncharacterized protein n=1 Tax=Algoriphagus boritolerans DSM 17298 = JCM 18970 TaxID=1120964 RepID=A0A1H5YW06_9BACT|nr:hypothetical protein [Algoriphagus boritolerans]SEG28208.1 hypothetical protein SAMN03080598_03197 [Algoriphagus boritolerans DSM 17298 = JCM 18970]